MMRALIAFAFAVLASLPAQAEIEIQEVSTPGGIDASVNFGTSRMSASQSFRPSAGMTPSTASTQTVSIFGLSVSGLRSKLGKAGLPSSFLKSPDSATR